MNCFNHYIISINSHLTHTKKSVKQNDVNETRTFVPEQRHE